MDLIDLTEPSLSVISLPGRIATVLLPLSFKLEYFRYAVF